MNSKILNIGDARDCARTDSEYNEMARRDGSVRPGIRRLFAGRAGAAASAFACLRRFGASGRLVRCVSALGLAALGLVAADPARAQAARQCNVANAQPALAANFNGGRPNGFFVTTAPDWVKPTSTTAATTRYGIGADGALVVTGNLGWNEASPALNNDQTAVLILVNGVVYARFLSGRLIGSQGTVQALNGAQVVWNGGTTAAAGNIAPFRITLPLSVTQVTGNTALAVRYENTAGVEGDDWLFNSINVAQCNARLAVRKATIEGAGRLGTEQFALSIAGSNAGADASYTTAGTGTAVTGGPGVVEWFDAGTQYTLAETISANADVYDTTYTCTNAAAAATGTVMPSGSGRSFDIAPVSGDNITCVFTNTRIAQNLSLAKTWVDAVAGHTATATTTGGTSAAGASNASFDATAPDNATGTAVPVSAGDVVTLPAETFGGGAVAGNYEVTVACTGGTSLAESVPPQTITIASSTTPTLCTYTNTRRTTDLSITKTNTPASGPADQAGDSVVGGTATTYSLVATNHATVAVAGAVVRDTPQAGVDCPATNAVTCTGTACPSAAITVGDLTGGGVTLGTLAAGAAVTLSFDCEVQR